MDYKVVSGVKLPHKMQQNAMGQDITLNITNIKINAGLADALFNVD